jgi:hypothetical protein
VGAGEAGLDPRGPGEKGRMNRRRKRRPTKGELRAMGVSPGLLMVHRVGPDGRARLEQLAPESDGRRRVFARRLTSATTASEGSSRVE